MIRTGSSRKLDPEIGFGIHVRPERIQASWLASDGCGEGNRHAPASRLAARWPGISDSRSVKWVRGRQHLSVKSGTDGLQHFELDLPVNAGAAVDWRIPGCRSSSHDEHRVCWPPGEDDGRRLAAASGKRAGRRSTTGYCDLTTDWVIARGRAPGHTWRGAQHRPSSHWARSLRLRPGSVVGQPRRCPGAGLVEPVGDGVRLVFTLRAARWGATGASATERGLPNCA